MIVAILFLYFDLCVPIKTLIARDSLFCLTNKILTLHWKQDKMTEIFQRRLNYWNHLKDSRKYIWYFDLTHGSVFEVVDIFLIVSGNARSSDGAFFRVSVVKVWVAVLLQSTILLWDCLFRLVVNDTCLVNHFLRYLLKLFKYLLQNIAKQ